MQPLETIQGQDWLGFAGIAATVDALDPQRAAGWRNREALRTVTRRILKDLVDLLLPVRAGSLSRQICGGGTHDIRAKADASGSHDARATSSILGDPIPKARYRVRTVV
jgi:hypothetical protein